MTNRHGAGTRRAPHQRPGWDGWAAAMPRWPSSAQRLACTIARMPARTAGGRFDHASTTAARAGSAGSLCTSVCTSLGDAVFPSGFSGLGSGLQIRIVGSTPTGASACETPAMCRQQRPSQGFFCCAAVAERASSSAVTSAPDCQEVSGSAGRVWSILWSTAGSFGALPFHTDFGVN